MKLLSYRVKNGIVFKNSISPRALLDSRVRLNKGLCIERTLGDNFQEIVLERETFSPKRNRMLSTSNPELYKFVKDGALEVFNRIASSLTFDEVPQLMTLFRHADEDFMNNIDQGLSYSPLEAFFSASLIESQVLRGGIANAVENRETVRKHIEMYKNDKIDSFRKAMAVINVLDSQLGFGNSTAFSMMQLPVDTIDFLKNGEDNFEYFKKLVFVCHSPHVLKLLKAPFEKALDPIPESTMFSDVDTSAFSDQIIHLNWVSDMIHEHPFTKSDFKEKMYGLTVGEVQNIFIEK